MTTHKFPGVYATIKDLSSVISTTAETACGYVGEAEFGPINTPVLLASATDYQSTFGEISSKYGYAGYSLAIASESINTHYFVRTVPVGDPNAAVEDRVNDAHWAALNVNINTATTEPAISTGYLYEEITAAEKARDAGMESGLFQAGDVTTAMIITATDPNNRKIYVNIKDSTINENKAFGVVVPTTFTDVEETSTKINVTLLATAVANIAVDDYIVVSGMSNTKLNGVFIVTEKTTVGANSILTYVVPTVETETADTNARIGKYPDPNETTFSITVLQKIGKVLSALETFPYCTLYQAKDNYGNSTFVEDVINDHSKFIQVFTNNNIISNTSQLTYVPAIVTEGLLANGKSGTWTDYSAKLTDLNANWEQFRDRSQVNVTLLMNSGYVQAENVSYQAKMLEIAEARRDCFCIFDSPVTETEFSNAIEWRKNIQGFDSYRVGTFIPWIKGYDSYQGRSNFVMCPSAYIAKVMGEYSPWEAPAGLNRAILGASAVSPTGLTQYYDETLGGQLYTDNQLNVLIRNPGAGYVCWGQRTAQAKPSALDRINVARTVIYIETILRDAAKWHVFDNNTPYNRLQITLQFSEFLNTVLSAGGIQRYQVICDTSNNTPIVIANNQLVIDIRIWPTYTAEEILINTSIQGADVSVTVTSS